jgi:hypothetical protein
MNLRPSGIDQHWTSRARYEDNDDSQPIIGVRLTNCERIFESAQTIQIFDSATVTIQFGFLQEQSVTLTREDGALFMDWLMAYHPALAGPALAVVPMGDRTPGPASAGLATGKARLVSYLAEAFPDVFGRGARATLPGADFYIEVMQLIQSAVDKPHRSRTPALILALEAIAHQLYINSIRMHVAAEHGAPEALAPLKAEARGLAYAADALREQAGALRAACPADLLPPHPTFPDMTPPAQPPRNPLAGQSPMDLGGPGYASQTLADHPEKQQPGRMVAVIDPLHRRYRQMGCIEHAVDSAVHVRFGTDAAEQFTPTQLMAIA